MKDRISVAAIATSTPVRLKLAYPSFTVPSQYTLQLSLTMFTLCSYPCAMWTTSQDLRFCIKMGLRKGLRASVVLRRALTDDEQDTVAKEIVEHLDSAPGRLSLESLWGDTVPISYRTAKSANEVPRWVCLLPVINRSANGEFLIT
jgi:hypothetical protein